MGLGEREIRKLPFERRVEKRQALMNMDKSEVKLLVLHVIRTVASHS